MNKYEPDYVSHPGQTLADCIKSAGMSKMRFLVKLPQHLQAQAEAVLDGTGAIDVALAEHLERLFDLPVRFWLRRQEQHDAKCLKIDNLGSS